MCCCIFHWYCGVIDEELLFSKPLQRITLLSYENKSVKMFLQQRVPGCWPPEQPQSIRTSQIISEKSSSAATPLCLAHKLKPKPAV